MKLHENLQWVDFLKSNLQVQKANTNQHIKVNSTQSSKLDISWATIARYVYLSSLSKSNSIYKSETMKGKHKEDATKSYAPSSLIFDLKSLGALDVDSSGVVWEFDAEGWLYLWTLQNIHERNYLPAHVQDYSTSTMPSVSFVQQSEEWMRAQPECKQVQGEHFCSFVIKLDDDNGDGNSVCFQGI